MQCPPTNPGLNLRKFHFVPAASRTSDVSMPTLSKMIASSFMSAMFKSRCVFSITLLASAALMLEQRCTPGCTMRSYSAATFSKVSPVSPDHLYHVRQHVFTIARVDAFRRVADEKPLLPRHPRNLLQHRNAHLQWRPDTPSIRRRRWCHSSCGREPPCWRRRAVKVGPGRLVDRRGHGDDNDVRLAEYVRITRVFCPHRGAHGLVRNLARRVDDLSARIHPTADDIEADRARMLPELDDERQTYIAEADDEPWRT